MIQSMNGVVWSYNLFDGYNMTKKKSNSMTLDIDYSRMWIIYITIHRWIIIYDYSRMLLFMFGFPVYWKIEPNSRAFSHLRQHLVYDFITKRSRQSCQKKRNMTSLTTIFNVFLQ